MSRGAGIKRQKERGTDGEVVYVCVRKCVCVCVCVKVRQNDTETERFP